MEGRLVKKFDNKALLWCADEDYPLSMLLKIMGGNAGFVALI